MWKMTSTLVSHVRQMQEPNVKPVQTDESPQRFAQMVEGYEQQLKLLATRPSAGLSVSTAVHAASVGEERFKKRDCRGASRLLRCQTCS